MTNYLDHIDRVAQGVASSHDYATLWDRLQATWKSFESSASLMKYDIFDTRESIYQIKMQALAKLLYCFPKASWQADCSTIRVKDRDYGGSWCRYGGCSAFMNLARKWHRFVEQVSHAGSLEKALEDDSPGGIMDDIQDLRCYLILSLSWIAAKSLENTK